MRLTPSMRGSSRYLGLTAVTFGLAAKSNCVVVCFIINIGLKCFDCG